MKMTQDKLDKIHAAQIYMIQELNRTCKEQNLHYTVICGSLLGTVRHKGFIPWDDDMDIALVREDYERLLKYLEKHPITGCELQSYSTDAHYYQPYAKLLKVGTVYIEKFRKNCKAKNGVFIDIFPLDYIEKPGKLETKIRRMLSRLLTFAIWEKEDCHMERKGAKKALNVLAAMLGLLPKNFLVNIQQKLVVNQHKEWRYVGSMFSSNYETDKLYFKRSEFDDLTELPFENITVFATKEWKKNLTRLYKSYMELPPIDKRNSGHDVYRVEL